MTGWVDQCWSRWAAGLASRQAAWLVVKTEPAPFPAFCVADCLHSVPVAQMGNYQEYLKMMPLPLREIDPDQPKRLHTFGNPFKQDKKVSRASPTIPVALVVSCWDWQRPTELPIILAIKQVFLLLVQISLPPTTKSLSVSLVFQGMMIDEADEFVAGPQNKIKRPGEPNTPASLKRRRNMSPLLRRPQSPPAIANHIGGKGPPSASSGSSPNSNLKAPPAYKGIETCTCSVFFMQYLCAFCGFLL